MTDRLSLPSLHIVESVDAALWCITNIFLLPICRTDSLETRTSQLVTAEYTNLALGNHIDNVEEGVLQLARVEMLQNMVVTIVVDTYSLWNASTWLGNMVLFIEVWPFPVCTYLGSSSLPIWMSDAPSRVWDNFTEQIDLWMLLPRPRDLESLALEQTARTHMPRFLPR